MFLLSLLHIMAKALSVALIAVTSSQALRVYLFADHGLYWLWKLARREFVFFLPATPSASWALAVVCNINTKVIADFTGCLHFRLPVHCGGAYFFFNLVSSQVSVLVAAHVYNEYFDPASVEDAAVTKMDETTVWRFFGALSAAWLATMTFFLARIAVPSYRNTCVHS